MKWALTAAKCIYPILWVQLDSALIEKLEFYSLRYLEKLSLVEMLSHEVMFMLFLNSFNAYQITLPSRLLFYCLGLLSLPSFPAAAGSCFQRKKLWEIHFPETLGGQHSYRPACYIVELRSQIFPQRAAKRESLVGSGHAFMRWTQTQLLIC